MILLDTHVFIWLVNNDEKLSDKYVKHLEEENSKYLSIISCWEISLLSKKERIKLKYPFNEWINNSIQAYNMELINLDLEIVLTYDRLDSFHSDPADKFIAATSISRNIPLLTFDQKLIDCKGINIFTL